jgi:hypothetical protein
MSVEMIASAVIDRARQVRGKWEISSHVTHPQGARHWEHRRKADNE